MAYMLYRVTVRLGPYTKDGWSHYKDVPSFLLDPNIQGIVSAEHAEQIARDMFEGQPIANVYASPVWYGEV